jgi:hypothetical protein
VVCFFEPQTQGQAGFVLKIWGDLSVFCFRDRVSDGYLSAKDAAAIELPPGSITKKMKNNWKMNVMFLQV